MSLDVTWNLFLTHFTTCSAVGWVGVDTEINAKPAQAEAGVGAGAELGNITKC